MRAPTSQGAPRTRRSTIFAASGCGRAHTVEGSPSELEATCSAPLQDAVVQGRQELALLHRTIDELPPKCRVVFLLSREHGLTMKEIAARLGISEKTVEKHILRAMTQCRQALHAVGRPV
jgi:RNA polymerase sigma-70 factor (ECF subfamily)